MHIGLRNGTQTYTYPAKIMRSIRKWLRLVENSMDVSRKTRRFLSFWGVRGVYGSEQIPTVPRTIPTVPRTFSTVPRTIPTVPGTGR